jgi:hypothetical protein
VKTHDKGAVIVTKVEPDKINFAVIHKKHPETFTMVRKSGPSTAGGRAKQTQGGAWLMINTTPKDVIKHQKVRYAKVPAEDVEKLFDEDYLHMEKIDGAAALYKLFSDKIEVLSYRPSAAGRPIVHTYRVGGTTGLNIPKHLVGSILRGELYGARDDRAIPPQELGGILNASTLKSLKKQREQKVQLRNAIFNVLKYGKKPVGMDIPIAERLDKVREILQHLPEGKFHLPRMAESPEEQRTLWEDIKGGRDPLTHEGIVAWPKEGGKPTKVKLYDEHDVFVQKIFPGEKRLEGVGAGGFEYSLSPEGPIVGKVGTGFSEELRRSMLEDPDRYLGRVARVKAQEKFPSGALRAPGLIAFHEDYPAMKKRAELPFRERAELYALSPAGKLLSGLYPGGDIGVYGGGIDPGEELLEAAVREAEEESGRKILNPRMLPIPPFEQIWTAPYKTEKEKKRAKQFKGSRTHYVAGELGRRKGPQEVEGTILAEIKLRLLAAVIDIQKKQLEAAEDPEKKRRLAARLSVLEHLLEEHQKKGLKKSALGPPTNGKPGSPRALPDLLTRLFDKGDDRPDPVDEWLRKHPYTPGDRIAKAVASIAGPGIVIGGMGGLSMGLRKHLGSMRRLGTVPKKGPIPLKAFTRGYRRYGPKGLRKLHGWGALGALLAQIPGMIARAKVDERTARDAYGLSSTVMGPDLRYAPPEDFLGRLKEYYLPQLPKLGLGTFMGSVAAAGPLAAATLGEAKTRMRIAARRKARASGAKPGMISRLLRRLRRFRR